ncbi:BglG family transcription antiterminator [Enterococcus sp. 669A]|uniref:Ascorbate-specific PTS system EIIA component n=1 Tax=Candidatus Enterococcus moelleringii TaxID=2815325 RepID=A0ABS3LGC4_9ENTE|nr:BglG family transcription antiterminator [Enterococcus sp. 669A]MBO1308687.1 BglG family transcription antiterminator [Enterococcus sp. 669A]
MLEEKYVIVLKEIISNPIITRKGLENKLQLSKDQIKYAVNKINDYLNENELPSIRRTRNGGFIIDAAIISFIQASEEKEQATNQLFYSEDERIMILALLLFNESLDLSLEYFSYELKVSKNTILRDLSKLKDKLTIHSIEITYSRTQGYCISGNELFIRDFIKETLFYVNKMSNGTQILDRFFGGTKEERSLTEKNLKAIEKQLEIRFTDEQFEILPYFLLILFSRIQHGKMAREKTSEEELSIYQLKEVRLIEEILSLEKFGKRETIYISLQILTSKIISAEFVNETITEKLRKALILCIDNFEVKTSIELKGRESILNSLMYHLTPAYYRIRYLINENNDLYEKEFLDNVIAQYDFLNSIIKDCFKPLEDLLEVPLPEIEIMYISLIFGSKILPQGKSDYPKMKTAIVICPKGVTYSQLMLSQLMDIFPEVYFYEPVSHRAFEKSNLKVDIIFSIGHFHSYDNCFVVQAAMSDEEKQQLRSQVFKKIFGEEDKATIVERIMGEIIEYLPKEKIADIQQSILEILGERLPTRKGSRLQQAEHAIMRISDFLSASKITILDQVADYKEAIRIAGQPLLLEGAVTEAYIQSVIDSHDFEDPYTILGQDVAIPHALPDEGVKKIGISLLIVREGFLYSKTQSLKLVFLIAPIDKKQHNQAIIDILTIAESPELIEKLTSTNDKQQILDLLKEISI